MPALPLELILLLIGAAAVRFSVNLFLATLLLAATLFVGGHAFPIVSDALGFPHRTVSEVFTGPEAGESAR